MDSNTRAGEILAAIGDELATEVLDVNVDVIEDKIVLSGMVDVLQDKLAAEEAARRVADGMRIENNLTVSMDGTIHDKEIAHAIERRLMASRLYVPAIVVHSGRVQLKGTVGSLKDVDRITERASEVLGVREIDTTQLQVKNHVVDDATLKNRIEAALAGVVSAPDIETKISNGKVALRGYVESHTDRQQIKDTISHIDGVLRLEDNVQVRDGKRSY